MKRDESLDEIRRKRDAWAVFVTVAQISMHRS